MQAEAIPGADTYDVTETAYHEPPRWNLGAGKTPLPGYRNLDRKDGFEAYPLACPDNSLDEIRASHVLEHFSHVEIIDVLKNWTAKLRPGGMLKVSVPDFKKVVALYTSGASVPIQGYIMGGHTDADDRHGCIFDHEALSHAMNAAGLERIAPWESDADDCSSYPISLNLLGYKPTLAVKKITDVVGVLSAPRFGPTMHGRIVWEALYPLGIPYGIGQGAYWHQVLAELLERAIAERRTGWVLTCDYDTIFTKHDVLELYRLATISKADAVCPLQMGRGDTGPLFVTCDAHGQRASVSGVEMASYLLPAASGHFGLTLFRLDALAKLPRPWFVSEPNAEGRWGAGRVDPDIGFWRAWQAAGLTLYVAPRVPVGHLVEAVAWPSKQMRPTFQTVQEYEAGGPPADVWRGTP